MIRYLNISKRRSIRNLTCGYIGKIEEYQHMLHKLRDKNQEFRNVLESVTDGIFKVDNEFRITYMNKACKNIFIYPSQMMGRRIWDVEPKYLNSQLSHAFHKAQTSFLPIHLEMCGKNSKRWFDANIYPSNEGLSVYIRNITQKKRNEESLRKSEELFSKAFHANPNPMGLFTLNDGSFISVNLALLTLTGYSEEEFISNHDVEFFLMSLQGNQTLQGLLTKQNKIANMEIKFTIKSGVPKVGLFSSEVIELNGEPCVLFTLNDITDYTKLKNELFRLDKLNLIGQMAAGIGHEIRNPLTSVRGFLQLLGDKEECRRYKDYYDLMIEELDRANYIIKEYLSLARKEPSDVKLHNLNVIIESLSPLLQADAMNLNKNINIKTELIPDLLLDEKEVRQLILNLARNGFESMPLGGELVIQTGMENDQVILSVIDQGKGIPKEILEQLGTPFITTKPEGTGLGLATCYAIASRQNAVIEIKTNENGTAIYVKFTVI